MKIINGNIVPDPGAILVNENKHFFARIPIKLSNELIVEQIEGHNGTYPLVMIYNGELCFTHLKSDGKSPLSIYDSENEYVEFNFQNLKKSCKSFKKLFKKLEKTCRKNR